MSASGVTDPQRSIRPARLSLQPVGEPFRDPGFKTQIRRVSRSGAGSFETQIYSQLQAFSPDERFVLLTSDRGYLVRRLKGLGRVRGFNTSPWNVPRWDPAVGHQILHFDTNADSDLELLTTNVVTGKTRPVFRFPAEYERIRGNQSFDELSKDGRWIAGMADTGDSPTIFAFDVERGSLGAQLRLSSLYAGQCTPDPQWGAIEPDWVGVSPLGRYLVVQWPVDGTSPCQGLETFDLETGAFVGRVYDGHQHGDLVTDGNGEELFMTFELYHPSGRASIGVRELPGPATVSSPRYLLLIPWEAGGHISCQGPPGACLVSTGFDRSNGWQELEGELFLLRLDGSVLRIAHHRSSSCGYWAQPRATWSETGKYAIFASDWGRGSGDCEGSERSDPYLVELRRGR